MQKLPVILETVRKVPGFAVIHDTLATRAAAWTVFFGTGTLGLIFF
jgi:hypothetical protein